MKPGPERDRAIELMMRRGKCCFDGMKCDPDSCNYSECPLDCGDIPFYSTDDVDALIVLDWMASDCWQWELKHCDGLFDAMFTKKLQCGTATDCDTLADAITAAALEAMA